MPDRYPWRAVTRAYGPRSGRGSTLGRDTSRRTRWWVLQLACGHVVERTVRYWPVEGRTSQRRSSDDVMPAPRRVRCEKCQKLAAPELIGGNGGTLTEEEARTIGALHRLAKRWPPTLTLASMSGGLCVFHTGDPRWGLESGPDRQEAVLDEIDGIPNDGGAW